MRRLINPQEAPPQDGDGWSFRYVFSEDAFIARASAYNDWKQVIKDHALANGLPIPSMAAAEDQLCGTLPPDRCKYEPGDASAVPAGFEYGDVLNWIKAIATKFVTGAEFVPQEEANRRAEICVRCPLNTQAIGGCGACTKMAQALTPGMASKSTPYDEKLKNCGLCKCYNKIQVHFPLEILRTDGKDPSAYPNYCWKHDAA